MIYYFVITLYCIIITALAIYYRYIAMFDSLTGVLNRKIFEKKLVECMKKINAHTEYDLYYFMFDLDKFKTINDTKGHLEGDSILKRVSKGIGRTLDSYPYESCIGRYGGEEFCAYIILPYPLTPKPILIDLLENIALSSCTCSIGAARYDITKGVNVHILVEKADKAMYQAKKEGGDTFEETY